MELQTAILTRQSVRKFKDTPVDEDVIIELLKMAQAAPSGGNGQSHVFGVVRNAEKKLALAEAAGNQLWIAGAPVVIACCARLDNDFRDLPQESFALEVNRLRWGEPFWKYLADYADWNAVAGLLSNSAPLIPAEHIALAAVAHGLSSCFVGWLNVDRASEILGLPANIRCLFLLPIGYADEQPEPKPRKSLREISFFDVYGDRSGEPR